MTKKILFKLALSLAAVVALVGLVMGIMSEEASKSVTAETGYTGQTTSEFIASIGESARQIGQDYNIYGHL